MDDSPDGPSLIDALIADPNATNRLLVDMSSDILAIHEPDGRLRWISPSVERVLGWTAQQRLDQDLQLVHPDDLPLIGEVRRRLWAGADAAAARVRLRHADGSLRWFDSTARAVRDAEGSPAALVVVTRDVHDQVTAEAALAASAKRYRLLTESMKDVVWTLDAESLRFTYVSPSVEALRGYTPEEIMAEPLDAALTPEAAAWLRQGIAADVAQLRAGTKAFGVFYTDEFAQPCKDGSMMWTEVVPTYQLNEDTGRIEIRAVTRDISARRAAAEALAASEQRYRLLAENSSDVVLHVRDGVTEWISPSIRDVLGWAPQDWLGQQVAHLVHPGDVDGLDAHHRRVLAGEVRLYRARVRDSAGRYRWVQGHARPYLDVDGNPDGVVSALRVVDEEVRAADALARSEELFRTAMESAPTGMALVDLDRRFLRVNPAVPHARHRRGMAAGPPCPRHPRRRRTGPVHASRGPVRTPALDPSREATSRPRAGRTCGWSTRSRC